MTILLTDEERERIDNDALRLLVKDRENQVAMALRQIKKLRGEVDDLYMAMGEQPKYGDKPLGKGRMERVLRGRA